MTCSASASAVVASNAGGPQGFGHHRRSRARRVHKQDVPGSNRLDGIAKQREMGTTQDDTVNVMQAVTGFVEVPTNYSRCDVAVGPTFFSQRHQQLTCLFANRGCRIASSDGFAIGAQPHGCLRRENQV